MNNIPPQFKSIKKYLREAKKFDKLEPVIAYHCRLYGVQTAMGLDSDSPEAKSYIGQMMSDLEEVKKSPNWVNMSKEEVQVKIENMALQVFDGADQVDRAGNATKKTAQAYNTAFVLLDCLKQFGDRDVVIETKAKYAMFKTHDILTAFKEGRKPDAGPPVKDDGLVDPNSIGPMGGGGGDLPDPNSIGGFPDPNSIGPMGGGGGGGGFPDPSSIPNMGGGDPPPQQPIAPYNPPAPSGPPMNVSGMDFGGNQPMPSQPVQPVQPRSVVITPLPANSKLNFEDKVLACAKAEELMKHGFSAMRFNDVDGACMKLEQALQVLAKFRSNNSNVVTI